MEDYITGFWTSSRMHGPGARRLLPRAEILLAAMKRTWGTGSAINIGFDERIAEAVTGRGLIYCRINRSRGSLELRSDEGEVAGVEAALADVETVPCALVDPGGHEIESITYVFGESVPRVGEGGADR